MMSPAATQRGPGRLVMLEGDLAQAVINKEISYVCTCVAVRAHGLAEAPFETPTDCSEARQGLVDLTSCRRGEGGGRVGEGGGGVAGTIIIRGKVINMLAQVYPGPPTVSESEAMRLHWFRACLEKMKEELDPTNTKSVAFPFKIGCGLAKGYWPHYHQALKEFAEAVPYYVYVIKLPDTGGVSAGTRARTGKRGGGRGGEGGGGRGGGGGGGGGQGKPAVTHE